MQPHLHAPTRRADAPAPQTGASASGVRTVWALWTAWTLLVAVLAAGLLMLAPPIQAAETAPVPAATAAGSATPATAADPRTAALLRASESVIGVQVAALEDARSARTLGRSRSGSGVVIGADGLVLTIGYLVLEAEQVALVLDDGRTLPARVLGYDQATGFGLVQALAPLGLAPVPLGRPEALLADTPLLVVSGGQGGTASLAQLVARRPFSGYWEYHIEGALFTTPPRRDHSGAGLFSPQGELVGIGSLLLTDTADPSGSLVGPRTRQAGNMFVPVDLLRPILDDLRRSGSSAASQRAWLGLNCVEQDGQLRVVRVTDDSPADVAGLQAGDRIVGIDSRPVAALATLWQALWAGGAPERQVSLQIERDAQPRTIQVYSVDRAKTLRRAEGI